MGLFKDIKRSIRKATGGGIKNIPKNLFKTGTPFSEETKFGDAMKKIRIAGLGVAIGAGGAKAVGDLAKNNNLPELGEIGIDLSEIEVPTVGGAGVFGGGSDASDNDASGGDNNDTPTSNLSTPTKIGIGYTLLKILNVV